jgi:hypothetical protein
VRTAFLPRGPHPLCLLNGRWRSSVEPAHSPVSTCHDSTAYLFAHRQKSSTNKSIGTTDFAHCTERVSRRQPTHLPSARLARTRAISAGKGTCAVDHSALGQLMASRIRRSARSPSLPVCLPLVTRQSQSLGLLSRMDLDRQPSRRKPDRRPRLPARTRVGDDENLGSLAWACIVSSKTSRW